MRIQPSVVAVLSLVMACASVFAQDSNVRTTKVTYVTTTSVYIDAGAEDGLAQGDRLEVVRDAKVIAELEVTFVSNRKAVCHRVTAEGSVEQGDEVRYTANFGARPAKAVEAPPPVPRDTPPPRTSSGGGLAALGLRGRIGVRYMWMRQSDGAQLTYQQPSLDLRVDGTHVGGANIDLGIDVRARRTYRTLGDGTSQNEGKTRVYSAFAAWQPGGGPWRLAAGRLFSPSLAVVSLFDGVIGEYRKNGFAAGVFTGSEPDPVSYAYSSEVKDHGAFIEFGNRSGAERRWAITSGAVGSYDNGEINREFVFLQGRYDDRRLSVYTVEELDVNRGWRKEAEQSSYDLTSSYLDVRWRIGGRFTLDGGFDNRRSVRLYRDLVSPETEFDDRYRRGQWIGADGRFGEHVTVGLNARRSDVDGSDTADSYSALIGVHRLTSWDLAVRSRTTRYTNAQVSGWLQSFSASGDLGRGSQLELHGGVRTETLENPLASGGRLTWFGADWSLLVGRRWFVILTAEHNGGTGETTDQFYGTVTYRF